MNRIFSFLLVLGLGLAIIPQGAWAGDFQGADGAMQAFYEAMIRKDSRTVLGSFSPKTGFKLISYEIGQNSPETITTVFYDKLKMDFAVRTGLYQFFFAKPDGWEYNVEFRQGEPWRKGPNNTYFAPQSSMGHTYIKWKQEGNRWVIDELAYVHP